MKDKHNLQRFLSAQGNSLENILQELKLGQKKGHWMWYVFPQCEGLGRSRTAERFAIRSKNEALEYLYHPILGPRLLECTKAVNAHQSHTAEKIFGYPDYLKFRSCMTLFEQISDLNNPFSIALERFFGGKADMRTLAILDKISSD